MENKIEEYRQLYSEIHSNGDKVAFALGVIYSGTSGIITYGLNSDAENSEYIFLTPLLLIIPLTFFIYSQLNSTTRIAAYLKVFHEDKNKGLYWEHRLGEFKSPQRLKNSKYARSIIYVILGISLICFALTFVNIFSNGEPRFKNLNIPTITISIVLFVLLSYGLYCVKKAKTKGYMKHYLNEFEEIKKREEEEGKEE